MAYQNNAEYAIEKKTYKYRPTGEIDSNGRPVFDKVGEPKTSVVKGVKNFTELKKTLAPDKLEENVKVKYKNPTYTATIDRFGRTTSVRRNSSRIDHVTKKLSDGSYEVSYYNAKKK